MSTDLDKRIRPEILASSYKHKADLIVLYVVLVINRDYATNLTHMSYKQITGWTGWRSEKINKTIDELKTIGLIDYYSGNSLGMSNLYAFPKETFGKNHARSILPPHQNQSTQNKTNISNSKNAEANQTDNNMQSTILKENNKEALSIDQMLQTLNSKGEENYDSKSDY